MSATTTPPGRRGGRPRGPIWEHFEKGADGHRSAACAYCAHVMKAQPDRMVAHFLRVCPSADASKRRHWLEQQQPTLQEPPKTPQEQQSGGAAPASDSEGGDRAANEQLAEAEGETEGETDAGGALDDPVVELKRQKLALETRKVQMQIESLNYDNELKRIKVVEENMLARKRLRDAGVPQDEIDTLLPLRMPRLPSV